MNRTWWKFIIGGLAAGYGLAYYALKIEPTWLQTRKVKIPVQGLPTAFHNFRIALLGDFHYLNGNMRAPYLQEIIDRTQELEPDMIVLTGDFLHDLKNVAEDAPYLATFLAQLTAPFGAFAVLGNHDYNFYKTGFQPMPDGATEQLCDSIQDAGIRILRNESHKIYIKDDFLQLVGFDDLDAGYFDASTALKGVNPNLPIIGLCHNPDAITHFWRRYRLDLLLCGHTHGNQVSIPFVDVPRVVRHPWLKQGLYNEEGIQLYINKGLGWGCVPVRFNARPEITLVVLKSA